MQWKRLERADGKEKIEGTDIFGDDYCQNS